MKKVLHILGKLDRGGAESYIMNSLRNIRHGKYHFIIATFEKPTSGKKYIYEDELKSMGVEIVRLKDTRFSNPRDFERQVENLVRKRGIDTVHSHIDFMSALTLAGAERGGATKLIAHSHSTSNSKLKSPVKLVASKYLKYRLNKLATQRIACGQAAGEFLFGKNIFTVIPNGIDLNKFKFSTKARSKLRKEYQIDENTKVWLTIGRLEEVKNQAFLIDLLRDYFAKTNTQLFIIGNGSLRAELAEKITRDNLEDKVHLLSARDDVNDYYSMGDFFLLPSFFEGVPTVGIEAQTNGLKCIFSDKVSREVAILKESEFVALKNREKWAEILKQKTSTEKRLECVNSKELQKYNIKESVKILEEIYDI